nr:MAG TPA_asm: hypothetical protein [Caudoviricetes sp.]
MVLIFILFYRAKTKNIHIFIIPRLKKKSNRKVNSNG